MLKLTGIFERQERPVRLAGRDAYDVWSDTYPASAHNPLMRLEERAVAQVLSRLRARTALDVGSGSGRYVARLAATGARVVALDFSLGMLAHQQTRRPRVCADACALPFRQGAFDIVNASLMVGDIADLDAWAVEMARVLTPGGSLIYSDFHPQWSERGWQRTFRSSAGRLHEIGFQPHAMEGHLRALERSGLRLRAVREPRLRDDGSADVRRFVRRHGETPVVAVFHAVKDLAWQRPLASAEAWR